jgi:hypothetical protein
MANERTRKMARSKAELATERLRVAKLSVRKLERATAAAEADLEAKRGKLARARKLLDIAREHPDLPVMSPDSHVAGHKVDPGADGADGNSDPDDES